MKKYLKLAAQIIRNGTMRGTGQNFHSTRTKSLDSLKEFIPNHQSVINTKKIRHYLIGQAAFIRASFRKKGGHLSVEQLAYIRIPKSANTSVSYAMLGKKFPGLKEKNPDETQINFLADVNLLSVKEIAGKFFFTVVRNPFARLVSVYRDFFETSHAEFIYSDYLFGILPQTISFAEFVNRISHIPDRLKDQHLRPQHLFVKPYEEKGIAVKFFQLEDSPALENFLKENGMELTHRNKSREAYDYTQYYNSTILRQVFDLYEADIKKFGYNQVYESLRDRIKP